MDRVKITMAGIFLGVLYAYLSIYIIGIGAAIAIPASILAPVAKEYPTFAFAMVDLITIAIPLITVYCLFVLVVKYFNSSKSYFPYLVLLIPFCIQHAYFFAIMGQTHNLAYTFATIMPRYIAIVAVALYFVKRAINHAKA